MQFNIYHLKLIFLLIFIISVSLIHNGINFGSFKIDYYEAHLLTMDVFSKYGLLDGTKEMYLSASGALPLWFQSQFESLSSRRLINISIWIFTLILLFKCTFKAGLNKESALLLLISYCLSPMILSSVAWGLSEIYALFFIYLVIYLILNNLAVIVVPVLFSFIILCRQNIIGLLGFCACFISSRQLKIASIIGSLSGLGLLIYLWGGLVPKGLDRHMTPSLRTFTYSIAIFSLYYIFCERVVRRYSYYVIITIFFFTTAVIYLTPDLLGGGYIFSRIENISKILSIIVISILIYSVYSLRSVLLILLILFSAVTLSTTNYIFLKYIDFFVYFNFSIQLLSLAYRNNIKVNNFILNKLCDDRRFLDLQILSILLFQIFSILLSFFYYNF